MKTMLIGCIMAFFGLVFAGFARRYSSETLINGFMDWEKAKKFAPTFFKKKNSNDS